MNKSTIIVSTDLRDVIKMGAAFNKVTMETYLHDLVYKDMDMEVLIKYNKNNG